MVKPPSQGLPHPSDYYYYFEQEASVWSNDMIMTDDNLLQDVRDLTQSLNFNTSRYNHTVPSITFISPKLTEILSKFRRRRRILQSNREPVRASQGWHEAGSIV